MKNILSITALLIAFTLVLGCNSKSQEEKAEETITAEETAAVEQAESKIAMLNQASEKRAEERRLATLEKIKASPTYTDADGRTVYLQTEVAPFYTGGEEEMMKYLRDNLKYPEEARKEGVEGIVFVDFVIDEQGKVSEVTATDFIGDDFDSLLKEESVRVVSSMTAWNAGLQQDKAVNVAFSLPIKFQLTN